MIWKLTDQEERLKLWKTPFWKAIFHVEVRDFSQEDLISSNLFCFDFSTSFFSSYQLSLQVNSFFQFSSNFKSLFFVKSTPAQEISSQIAMTTIGDAIVKRKWMNEYIYFFNYWGP